MLNVNIPIHSTIIAEQYHPIIGIYESNYRLIVSLHYYLRHTIILDVVSLNTPFLSLSFEIDSVDASTISRENSSTRTIRVESEQIKIGFLVYSDNASLTFLNKSTEITYVSPSSSCV